MPWQLDSLFCAFSCGKTVRTGSRNVDRAMTCVASSSYIIPRSPQTGTRAQRPLLCPSVTPMQNPVVAAWNCATLQRGMHAVPGCPSIRLYFYSAYAPWDVRTPDCTGSPCIGSAIPSDLTLLPVRVDGRMASHVGTCRWYIISIVVGERGRSILEHCHPGALSALRA